MAASFLVDRSGTAVLPVWDRRRALIHVTGVAGDEGGGDPEGRLVLHQVPQHGPVPQSLGDDAGYHSGVPHSKYREAALGE